MALGDLRNVFYVLSDLNVPVICIELVCTLVLVALAKCWSTRYIYFKGKCFHSILEKWKEIMMKLPRIYGTSLNGQMF